MSRPVLKIIPEILACEQAHMGEFGENFGGGTAIQQVLAGYPLKVLEEWRIECLMNQYTMNFRSQMKMRYQSLHHQYQESFSPS